MAVDLSQFQESFFTESAEHVETIESGLLALEQRPKDLDLLNRIFRGAHSIKGNAGMFHFTAIAELTHKMENILDDLRNEKMLVQFGIELMEISQEFHQIFVQTLGHDLIHAAVVQLCVQFTGETFRFHRLFFAQVAEDFIDFVHAGMHRTRHVVM